MGDRQKKVEKLWFKQIKLLIDVKGHKQRQAFNICHFIYVGVFNKLKRGTFNLWECHSGVLDHSYSITYGHDFINDVIYTRYNGVYTSRNTDPQNLNSDPCFNIKVL